MLLSSVWRTICFSTLSLLDPFKSLLVCGLACRWVTAHPCRHGDDSNTTLLSHSSFFSIQSIWISLLLHTPLLPPSHSVPGGIPEPARTRPGARPGTRPEQVKLLPVSFMQATVSGWIKASQVCNSHGTEPTHNMNGSLKISLNKPQRDNAVVPAGEYLVFKIKQELIISSVRTGQLASAPDAGIVTGLVSQHRQMFVPLV